MKILLADIKRALLSAGVYLAALGMAAVMLVACAENIAQALRSGVSTPVCELMWNALNSDAMAFALPILCTLPYTVSFLEELRSGFIKACLPRAGAGLYVWSKGIACALSGALSLLLGLAIFGCVAFALLPAQMPDTVDAEAAIDVQFESELQLEEPAFSSKLRQSALMAALCGSLWASVGLALCTLTGSKYMAYASPFVAHYVLVILHERYFRKFFLFYPREWIASARISAGTVGLLLLVLTGGMLLVFAWIAKRRIERI